MELSPQGATLAWFGTTMTIVGVIFNNLALMTAAIAVLAFLVLRAASFRRHVNTIRGQLSVRIEPEISTTLVNAFFKFEAHLTNLSLNPVAIGAFQLALPVEIETDNQETRQRQLLSQKSFITYTALAQALSPGLFKASSAAVTVEDRSTLLVDVLRLRCNMTIEATPILTEPRERIETSDPRKLGAGTEVAGVREAVTEDDFRVIDWKSTARTGKFIAKEFSQELTPPAIIAVDKSVLTRAAGSQANVLAEVTRLMVSFAPSTRVGLIIFDDRKVTAHCAPSVGHRSMQQMISTLVAASGENPKSTPREIVTRSYVEMMNTVQIMKATIANRPRRMIDVFTRSLLPYYENALSNYPSNLRRQGSFQALVSVSKLQQHAFVIVITSLGIDLSGICEGSVNLSQIGHRVVIALISNPTENIPPELLRLRQVGILMMRSSGSELLNGIRAELRNPPRIRTHSVNPS